MSRTPIQVPEELKVEVEKLKGEFRSNTLADVLQRLVVYYSRKDRHVHLDIKEEKEGFIKEMNRLDLDESEMFELIFFAWQNSAELKKEVFEKYLELRDGEYRWK